MGQVSVNVINVNAAVQALMSSIVNALVDQSDEVRVELLDQDDLVLIRVHVARQDIGKLIGKQGGTARSLRTMLSAVGMKHQQRFALDIVEV